MSVTALAWLMVTPGCQSSRDAAVLIAPSQPQHHQPPDPAPDPDPVPPPVPPPPLGRHVISNAGAYLVTYETDPPAIPMNEPFTIRVRLFEQATGRVVPADEIALAVDARMPEHFHGMNRVPVISRDGSADFTATGMLFHMHGSWELYFDITRGGVTERAQTRVELE
jgi:hypothetical protein